MLPSFIEMQLKTFSFLELYNIFFGICIVCEKVANIRLKNRLITSPNFLFIFIVLRTFKIHFIFFENLADSGQQRARASGKQAALSEAPATTDSRRLSESSSARPMAPGTRSPQHVLLRPCCRGRGNPHPSRV